MQMKLKIRVRSTSFTDVQINFDLNILIAVQELVILHGVGSMCGLNSRYPARRDLVLAGVTG